MSIEKEIEKPRDFTGKKYEIGDVVFYITRSGSIMETELAVVSSINLKNDYMGSYYVLYAKKPVIRRNYHVVADKSNNTPEIIEDRKVLVCISFYPNQGEYIVEYKDVKLERYDRHIILTDEQIGGVLEKKRQEANNKATAIEQYKGKRNEYVDNIRYKNTLYESNFLNLKNKLRIGESIWFPKVEQIEDFEGR